jgi:hypothetical protein
LEGQGGAGVGVLCRWGGRVGYEGGGGDVLVFLNGENGACKGLDMVLSETLGEKRGRAAAGVKRRGSASRESTMSTRTKHWLQTCHMCKHALYIGGRGAPGWDI